MIPRHVPVTGEDKEQLTGVLDEPAGQDQGRMTVSSRQAVADGPRLGIDADHADALPAGEVENGVVLHPVEPPPVIEGDPAPENPGADPSGQELVHYCLIPGMQHLEGERDRPPLAHEGSEEPDRKSLGGREGVVVAAEDQVGPPHGPQQLGRRGYLPAPPEIALIGGPISLQFHPEEADKLTDVLAPDAFQLLVHGGDLSPYLNSTITAGPSGEHAMTHRKKFVTSREIWTVYSLMVGAAFFWGGLLSVSAMLMFRFNQEALYFLAMLTIVTGLCAGTTTYVGMRQLLVTAGKRARNSDLDLP